MDKKRIMVVEDEALIALDIKNNLIRLGYEVPAIVASGEAAIRCAEQVMPDLILMDITLDGAMNGLEAAISINKAFAIPVVFLTAHSDNEMLKLGQAAGAYGFLPKPYDARALKSTIEMAHARFQDMVEIRRLNEELQQSIDKVEKLRKHLPVCSWCKQVRASDGSWHELDRYLTDNAEFQFTHGICPVCKKTIARP
ncbi:MAG: response regulator [Bdellovibrio sp.]|nr:response regulator [Bdellovibrio sp.]